MSYAYACTGAFAHVVHVIEAEDNESMADLVNRRAICGGPGRLERWLSSRWHAVVFSLESDFPGHTILCGKCFNIGKRRLDQLVVQARASATTILAQRAMLMVQVSNGGQAQAQAHHAIFGCGIGPESDAKQ